MPEPSDAEVIRAGDEIFDFAAPQVISQKRISKLGLLILVLLAIVFFLLLAMAAGVIPTIP